MRYASVVDTQVKHRTAIEPRIIVSDAPAVEPVEVQPAGFLLELSSDWLILRASENVHKFLGQYHVTLVGEPLSKFTLAQPLHDLRNNLARQRSCSGIARAYRVRLTEERRHFDMAFQMVDGRILLEGMLSPDDGFGMALGSVSRLIDGLDGSGRALLDSAARRIRALTGFDTAILTAGGETVESARAPSSATGSSAGFEALPAILTDTKFTSIPVYPRDAENSSAGRALLRAPNAALLQQLREQEISSMLNVPVLRDEEAIGHFRCENRAPMPPTFELHAAAELFAQVLAMQLER